MQELENRKPKIKRFAYKLEVECPDMAFLSKLSRSNLRESERRFLNLCILNDSPKRANRLTIYDFMILLMTYHRLI